MAISLARKWHRYTRRRCTNDWFPTHYPFFRLSPVNSFCVMYFLYMGSPGLWPPVVNIESEGLSYLLHNQWILVTRQKSSQHNWWQLKLLRNPSLAMVVSGILCLFGFCFHRNHNWSPSHHGICKTWSTSCPSALPSSTTKTVNTKTRKRVGEDSLMYGILSI